MSKSNSKFQKVLSSVTSRSLKPRRLQLPKTSLKHSRRLLYQQRLFDKIAEVPGDVVECGVGRGHSFLHWSMLCHEEGKGRRLWGFDSFEGFPAPTQEDNSPRRPKEGEWNVSSEESIMGLINAAGLPDEWSRSCVTLVKGFFENTLAQYTGQQIALLHIDADLYQSYKTVLETLYPKVATGGIIAFDEYAEQMQNAELKWPGAKKAVDEFFADREVDILRDERVAKYYVVKSD